MLVMCGIAAIIAQRSGADESAIQRMTDALQARGPDSGRVWRDSVMGVSLGHRRLKVIDLSENASQPMCNETRDVWVIFNGEIYNHIELRRQLVAMGHRFQSRADTEVLVHGYEEWGQLLVNRLSGIFAFAVWDGKKRELFAARDQCGVKPLYYAVASDDSFLIASTPSAMLASGAVQRKVDPGALQDYLTLGYVPYDRSIYQNVRQLPAGHFLRYNGSVSTQRYWQARYRPVIRNAADAVAAVSEGLQRAVVGQMESDIPLGTLLSGGVDSSIVSGIAARKCDKPIRTFTIGFDDPTYDERRYAQCMSNHIRSRYTEDILTRNDVSTILPQILDGCDEPCLLNGMLPSWTAARLARRWEHNVVLAGDGGDELFAGYTHYGGRARQSSRLELLCHAFKLLLSPEQRASSVPNRYSPNDHLAAVGYFSPSDGSLEAVLGSEVEFNPRSGVWALEQFTDASLPAVTAAQLVDFNLWLVDHVLCKVDRATMAHGVEARVPLLDVALVELAFSIDAAVLFPRQERKGLLKHVAAAWVPKSLLNGRKKGFSSPIGQWTTPSLREWGKQLLRNGYLCNAGFLRSTQTDLMTMHSPPRIVWLLLSAELWARRWIAEEQICFPPETPLSVQLRTSAARR